MIFIKILFIELFISLYAKVVGYYKSIDVISIYRWDKIEKGHYKYLYKRAINRVPECFKVITTEMFYQFEKINVNRFRKLHEIAYRRSLWVTSGKVQHYNSANFIAAEFEKESKKKIKQETLNEKVNYIEASLNSIGSIDVHKMSASRFYSLLDLATQKNKQTHGNN